MADVLLVAGLGAVAGFSIGCVGIGGVIIVPALVYLAGIPIQVAIAGAMMGYCLTGLVGTSVYAAAGSIRWHMAGWLCAGAMPAALAGAWMSNNMPASVLELGIGGLALLSGFQALGNSGPGSTRTSVLGRHSLLGIGFLTGLLSALTGTGGPLVLVPLMMSLNVPVLTAIGLSQAVQLPIAALATAGNVLFGRPDFVLGAMLGVGLTGGSLAGARFAHRLPQQSLKRVVGTVLIAVGASMILRILWGHVIGG